MEIPPMTREEMIKEIERKCDYISKICVSVEDRKYLNKILDSLTHAQAIAMTH